MYKIFGCKVNKFYINQRLAAYGEQEDTFLIATCVVTDRAKNKWLKQAEKALKS
jgi:tRNA A37 methylthiotransferase MiaB